jgi:hypothetical protein
MNKNERLCPAAEGGLDTLLMFLPNIIQIYDIMKKIIFSQAKL